MTDFRHHFAPSVPPSAPIGAPINNPIGAPTHPYPPLKPVDTSSWARQDGAGFMHDREPAPHDVARLRELSPISDNETGWLHLAWESGDEWIPAQRWVLYEMLHEQFVDDDVIKELDGPHPRSEGHMCSVNVPKQFQCLCRRKLEKWKGGPCDIVTLNEQKIWKRMKAQYGVGYVPRAFWVIQGAGGGHKWDFNGHEQELLKMLDKPEHPPRVGTLPYAPFDERVCQAIMRENKLIKLGVTLGEFKRMMSTGYQRHREDLARDLRRQYIAHLDTQLQDVNELFISAARKGQMDDHRKTEIDYVRLEAESTAHFVETGNVLHPSEV